MRVSVQCLLLIGLAWFGTALYAVAEPGDGLQRLAPAFIAAGMIGFVVVHGLARYGGRAMLVFTLTIFVIGWSFEMVSISTGFPFGRYHYTDIMRPFLGHVPVIVMPTSELSE